MPFPLNFTNREFADQTRMPAASLARAMSELYEAFALIEEKKFPSVHDRFGMAHKKLMDAIIQMKGLTDVESRWEVGNDPVFERMLSDFTELTNFTPMGDRSAIDFLISEMHALGALIDRYADHETEMDRVPSAQDREIIPPDTEDQAHLIRNILDAALRLQQVGLIVTQISMITNARPI